jgi:hypothetical protein
MKGLSPSIIEINLLTENVYAIGEFALACRRQWVSHPSNTRPHGACGIDNPPL